MMINRRRFLQAAAAAGAVLVWPRRAFPFAQSIKGIRKFAVGMPGLGPAGANNMGNYIPVLEPDAALSAKAGVTVYSIEAAEFTQQVHPQIPPTTFWGYADKANLVNGKPDRRYLGGVIVATTGTPVQLRVTNRLPALHILPVDLSLVDQAVVPTGGRTDIIAVHLHGGFVFWNSDGGPFSWYSADNPPGPVTGPVSKTRSVQESGPLPERRFITITTSRARGTSGITIMCIRSREPTYTPVSPANT